MARRDAEQHVTQSLIERLINLDPGNQSTETPPTRAQSVRQLKAALRRDLEWLLNTRRRPDAAGAAYPELEHSLFNFGLPDVSALNWDSAQDRTKLTRIIEQALKTFEPRISRTKVVPLPSLTEARHVLRFQIEGLLDMDPAPEHITFDTVLQLSSGEYSVKGDGSAG